MGRRMKAKPHQQNEYRQAQKPKSQETSLVPNAEGCNQGSEKREKHIHAPILAHGCAAKMTHRRGK